MKDLEPYTLSLEVLGNEQFENDMDLEEEHPLISEMQAKYNSLNERLVSLKALTETLKQQVENEKALWQQELQETIQMERQFKEVHKKHHEMLIPDESELKRKYEIFRDFLFFTQATENIEKLTRKNNYQQWLSEVESECSIELDRIQRSLTALRPLKEMASKWRDDVTNLERGPDGDKEIMDYINENEHGSLTSKEIDHHETINVKEIFSGK